MKESNIMDISIIIPMFNAASKIERAINSVLKQTIINSTEIICIDDGSTDNTIKIVKNVIADNIHIYNQVHLGAGPARNLGLTKSTGRFVAFLDADDELIDIDALEKMIRAADKHNVNICGSLRKVVDNGEEKEAEIFSNFKIGKEGLRISYSDYQKNYDYQSYIFRKKFLEEKNIYFPNYKRYQDPPFFVKAMSEAKEFFVVPVYLYRYYYENDKQEIVSKYIEDVLNGMRECAKLALDNNYKTLLEEIDEQIKNQYWANITQNMTFERLDLLKSINDIYRKSRQSDLSAMKEILGIYDTKEQLRKIGISNDLMRKLVLINLKQRSWRKYFEINSLKRVVLHGLGTYGEILLDILKQSNVDIIYAIDIYKTECENIDVKQEYISVDCDAVIVSLSEPDVIMKEYSEKGIKSLAFKDMINELSEGLI